MVTLVLVAGGLVTSLAFADMPACQAGRDQLMYEGPVRKASQELADKLEEVRAAGWPADKEREVWQMIADQSLVFTRAGKARDTLLAECLDAQVAK